MRFRYGGLNRYRNPSNYEVKDEGYEDRVTPSTHLSSTHRPNDFVPEVHNWRVIFFKYDQRSPYPSVYVASNHLIRGYATLHEALLRR